MRIGLDGTEKNIVRVRTVLSWRVGKEDERKEDNLRTEIEGQIHID